MRRHSAYLQSHTFIRAMRKTLVIVHMKKLLPEKLTGLYLDICIQTQRIVISTTFEAQ